MIRNNSLLLRFPPVAWVVFIGLLWVIVDFPGRLSGDSPGRLQTAHALWTGEDEFPETYEMYAPEEVKQLPENMQRLRAQRGILGKDGKFHFVHEAGQALIMIPADWLATKLHRFFPKQDQRYFRWHVVSLLTFFPLSLLIVLSCYWLLISLGFSKYLSAVSSIIWLICTTAFSSIHNQQRESQILLLAMLGYSSALSYFSRKKQRFAFLCGICAGFAFIIRNDSIFHGFCLFLFFAGGTYFLGKEGERILLKPIIFWIMGFSLMFFLGRTIEYYRLGSFWSLPIALQMKQLRTAAYLSSLPQLPDKYPFINPFYVGIIGVLFTPAKSIFIYDPLLLPGMLIGIFACKKVSPYTRLFIICSFLSLIMIIVASSKLDVWHGDAAWGARYHLISVELMLIPLIAILIKKMIAFGRNIRLALYVLLAVAFCLQFLSIIFRPSVESHKIFYASFNRFFDFRVAERIDNIRYLIDSTYFKKDLDKAGQERKALLTEKLAILPASFGKNRPLVFCLWSIALFLALIVTVWFIKRSLVEIKKEELE